MELLLTRSERGGLMGGVKFSLMARVQLSAEELAHYKRYKLGDVVLYERGGDKLATASGTLSILAARMAYLKVTAADLISGKSIEVKDIVDVMNAQDQIKEAVEIFSKIMRAASTFEGEEVLTF
jgi:hypothetical protein